MDQDWRSAPLSECVDQIFKMTTDAFRKLEGGHFSSSGETAMLQYLTTERQKICLACLPVLRMCDKHAFDDSIYHMTFQVIIDRLLTKVASKTRAAGDVTPSPRAHKALTLEEKQVLHYASGYIPRKLLRRYRRSPKNKTAQLFADVVRCWISAGNQSRKLTADVTAWTQSCDRGGLYHISVEFFHFMKILEENVEQILHWETLTQFAGQDVILEVGGQLKANDDVTEAFKALMKDSVLSEELSEVLFDQVVMSWVATKARQVVNQYINKRKSTDKGSVSKKGTPALRKTLDKH